MKRPEEDSPAPRPRQDLGEKLKEVSDRFEFEALIDGVQPFEEPAIPESARLPEPGRRPRRQLGTDLSSPILEPYSAGPPLSFPASGLQPPEASPDSGGILESDAVQASGPARAEHRERLVEVAGSLRRRARSRTLSVVWSRGRYLAWIAFVCFFAGVGAGGFAGRILPAYAVSKPAVTAGPQGAGRSAQRASVRIGSAVEKRPVPKPPAQDRAFDALPSFFWIAGIVTMVACVSWLVSSDHPPTLGRRLMRAALLAAACLGLIFCGIFTRILYLQGFLPDL